jgi:hypothetical protein
MIFEKYKRITTVLDKKAGANEKMYLFRNYLSK